MKNKKQYLWILIVMVFLCIGFAWITESKPDKCVDIFLIRHSQTISNTEEKLVGGDGDSPLTETGMKMAEEAGKGFEDIGITKAFCSKLGRARTTAEIILQYSGNSGIVPQIISGLEDISWGNAEGMTAKEYMEKYHLDSFPDAFGDAADAEFVSPIEGAETKYNFCKRFDQAMQKVVDQSDNGDKVLVVAHSSMMFWLRQKFGDNVKSEIGNCEGIHLKYENGDYIYLEE